MKKTLPIFGALLLTACGGGGGSTTAANPVAAFSNDAEIVAAARKAQERGNLLVTQIAQEADPQPQAMALGADVQPLNAAPTTYVNAIFLTDPKKTLNELLADGEAVDQYCLNDPNEDCNLTLVEDYKTALQSSGASGLFSAERGALTYTINGKTYKDENIEIIHGTDVDGDFALAGYSCEVTPADGGYVCVPGTLIALSAGTPLTNLPRSGTARYAGFFFGEVSSEGQKILDEGGFEIVINLSGTSVSTGTITGNGTAVDFSGNLVANNSSGLIGSSNVTVSYNELEQSGFMMGWLNGDGGTLVSGVVSTPVPTTGSGFGFDGLFAGAKVDPVP